MSGSPELGCGDGAKRRPHTGSRGCGQTNRRLRGRRVMHCKALTGGTLNMNLSSLRQKTGRLALVTASTGFVVGLAFLNGGQAHSIGGLCNGEPASHTWLDASGQY